jgi:hypothetical protein
MIKRLMAKTWRLRLRRFGWALSLTIGLDPRRFAWTHHRHRNVGFGPAGVWGFGWGLLTYLDCRGGRREAGNDC